MAKITNENIGKYCYLDDENFERKQMEEMIHLKTSIIKNLVVKQFSTNATLKNTIENKKEFVSTGVNEDLIFNNVGLSSYSDLMDNNEKEDKVKYLISCGLDKSDLDVLFSSLNSNESGSYNQIAYDRLYDIDKKLKFREDLNNQGNNDEYCLKQDIDFYKSSSSVAHTSKEREGKIYAPIDPMNYIKELEKSLFSSKAENSPNRDEIKSFDLHKRKLNRLGNVPREENERNKFTKIPIHEKPKSFWDMEKIPLFSSEKAFNPSYSKGKSTSTDISSNFNTKSLEKINNSNSENCIKFDYSKPFVYQIDQKDLIKNCNIVSNRLSINEIKMIDKFGKYKAGSPTETLYIKNLPHNLDPKIIIKLFGNFEQEGKQRIEYRILSGKMKGQAFINFSSIDIAKCAMDICNGYLIDGKPLVIEYARGRKMRTKT